MVKNTVIVVCDLCKTEDTNIQGHFHPVGWLWVRVDTFVNDGTYKHKKESNYSKNFCSVCYKIHGRNRLIEKFCSEGET